LHAKPLPQLRLPVGAHAPPWQASPTVQKLSSLQGVAFATVRGRQLPLPSQVSGRSQALVPGLPQAVPLAA
jgi:hypothetical protein